MIARGWLGLFALSVRLGVRHLLRHGFLREAVVRVVVPMDPSRYLEFPETLRELAARPGERVIDLASPKLVAVRLARQGVEVVSVDELPSEIETWRRLTGRTPGLTLQVADGRGCRSTTSLRPRVLDLGHRAHPGRRRRGRAARARPRHAAGRAHRRDPALRRRLLARTGATATLYVDHGGADGRHFFGRWYDAAHVDALRDAVAPLLEERGRRLARLSPMAVNHAYERYFPLLVPLGWLFPFLVHEVDGPGGDMLRMTFVKRAP